MKTLTVLLSAMLLTAAGQALAETEESEKVDKTGTRLKMFEPVTATGAEKPAGELDTSELDAESAAVLKAALAAEKETEE